MQHYAKYLDCLIKRPFYKTPSPTRKFKHLTHALYQKESISVKPVNLQKMKYAVTEALEIKSEFLVAIDSVVIPLEK